MRALRRHTDAYKDAEGYNLSIISHLHVSSQIATRSVSTLSNPENAIANPYLSVCPPHHLQSHTPQTIQTPLATEMCYTLFFPSLPSLCHAVPKHLFNLTMYFICDGIINNPQWGMAHCKTEDCVPYGVFGSYRSKGECPHCIGGILGGRVLFVWFFFFFSFQEFFLIDGVRSDG